MSLIGLSGSRSFGFYASSSPVRFECMASGGVLSPGTLGELARAAQQFGATAIRVTGEQNLSLDLPDVRMAKSFRASPGARLFSDANRSTSISSSVASAGLEAGTPWLTESVYLDLLALFHSIDESDGLRAHAGSAEPQRIHLGDPRLSLTPRFPADWNFLAADIRHHWRLTLYDRHGVLETASYLLPSYLLADVVSSAMRFDQAGERLDWIKTRFADSILEQSPTTPNISRASEAPSGRSEKRGGQTGRTSQASKSPPAIAPYEGLLAAPDGASLWLGVYRAGAGYPPLFLDELAYLCRKHKVGRVYATSWHSLLIKHIPNESREEWSRLIARHGLNLRHESPALYWQVDAAYDNIRERVVRGLRDADEGTTGLSFAVGRRALRSDALVAIVPGGAHWTGERFDLFHKKDFQRDQLHWQKFAGNLSARELTRAVRDLIKRFYEAPREIGPDPEDADSAAPVGAKGRPDSADFPDNADIRVGDNRATDAQVYVCSHCLTHYDPRYGDARAAVAAETRFEDLPADYRCPVCEAPRDAFVILEAKSGGDRSSPRTAPQESLK